jgi:hypothetical protein
MVSRTDKALPLVAGAVEEFRRHPRHAWPALTPLYAGTTCLSAGRIDEADSHTRELLVLTVASFTTCSGTPRNRLTSRPRTYFMIPFTGYCY